MFSFLFPLTGKTSVLEPECRQVSVRAHWRHGCAGRGRPPFTFLFENPLRLLRIRSLGHTRKVQNDYWTHSHVRSPDRARVKQARALGRAECLEGIMVSGRPRVRADVPRAPAVSAGGAGLSCSSYRTTGAPLLAQRALLSGFR